MCWGGVPLLALKIWGEWAWSSVTTPPGPPPPLYSVLNLRAHRQPDGDRGLGVWVSWVVLPHSCPAPLGHREAPRRVTRTLATSIRPTVVAPGPWPPARLHRLVLQQWMEACRSLTKALDEARDGMGLRFSHDCTQVLIAMANVWSGSLIFSNCEAQAFA